MLKLGQNYDLLCNMIIRPPRFVYDIADLGPRYFSAGGKPAQRTDFELRNGRGMILQCSHFEPLTSWDTPMPCVIYLHGNGGCRIEALDVVHTLLPADVSVFALDFAGSGLSEGEYVSLGYWEQYDVATAVQYLREANRCSTIGLWGRSMGAVTAILYSMQDPSIASMVLDSPFCSLQKIAEDLVLNVETLQKMPRFTKFAVNLAMKPIRSTIKKKAKFDIRALEILELVPNCFIPALFIHGKDDNFVLPMHSELLYNSYCGDKNRILVDGNHNSMRPNFFLDSVVIFFNNTLNNGAAHVMPTTSTLPELPLSMPQRQAEIQLQQINEILHPLQSHGNHTQTQAQVTPAAMDHAAQAHAQPHLHASQGLVMEEIDVSMEPLPILQNHHGSTNGLHGSVVIDDMVIGNTVMIDGKEVVLDNDADAYYSSSTTPPPSFSSHSTPSHTIPSLSSTPTNLPALSSTPPHTHYEDHASNNTNAHFTNNAVTNHTNDELTGQTTNVTYPTTAEGFIVHDNAQQEEEDIPEDIEDNSTSTLSFGAAVEMPEEN